MFSMEMLKQIYFHKNSDVRKNIRWYSEIKVCFLKKFILAWGEIMWIQLQKTASDGTCIEKQAIPLTLLLVQVGPEFDIRLLENTISSEFQSHINGTHSSSRLSTWDSISSLNISQFILHTRNYWVFLSIWPIQQRFPHFFCAAQVIYTCQHTVEISAYSEFAAVHS